MPTKSAPPKVHKEFLPPRVIAMLKARLEQNQLLAFSFTPEGRRYDLLFPSNAGTPIQVSRLLKNFKALLHQAGLPRMRFHDLRHTCATYLLSEGVEIALVQAILGHSQISLTVDLYGKNVKPQRGALEAINKLIGH